MTALTTLPWWVVLPACLIFVVGVALGARVLLHRFLGDATPHALANSATFMAGFGALFAFLSAFVISTEWAAQSAADQEAAAEAAAAARLAWVATAPGVDAAGLQRDVADYVHEVVTVEWPAMSRGDHVSTQDSAAYRSLQQEVRAAAVQANVSPVAANELMGALDALAEARRDRLTLADRELPLPLFLALGFSGLALCINAALQTIPNSRRANVVFCAIAAVVALDIGVLLVLSGPYRGTVQTSPRPLVEVRSAIDSGYFTEPS